MYKSCPRCGKIHDYNFQCKATKKNYGEAQERKLRSTWAWTLKSKEIREKAHYLCEVCRDNNEINYNVEVHHIEKIRDDTSLLLDNLNLICLCVEHHKQADTGELDKEYLKQLARQREGGEQSPLP